MLVALRSTPWTCLPPPPGSPCRRLAPDKMSYVGRAPCGFTAPAIPLHFLRQKSECSDMRRGDCRGAAPTDSSVGLWAVAPGWSGVEPRTPNMTDKPLKLSATGRAMLTLAASRDDRTVSPPTLPIAAARSVVRSLTRAGLFEEVPAPSDEPGLFWREEENGERLALRATAAGLDAIGVNAAASEKAGESQAETCTDSREATELQPSADAPGGQAVYGPPKGPDGLNRRATLRQSVQALLDAWDDTANNRASVADAVEQLRGLLARPERITTPTRRPRENTKQAKVLAMLRRPEGATVAQIAQAMNWAPHTVRGFFAGVQKRLGITVTAAERMRQVGPGKKGVKGSYTAYRIIEVG